MDLIHVGYPKCGSSWLQYELFPRIDSVNVIVNDMNHEIIYLDDPFYDREHIYRELECRKKRKKMNVYSCEAFLTWRTYANISRSAERLSQLYPNSKIMIILRNQKEILKSIYKFEVVYGYQFSPEWFLDEYCKNLNFIYNLLDYENTIKVYQNFFKDVHVLLFERVFEQKKADHLFELIGVSKEKDKYLDVLNIRSNPGADTQISLQMSRIINRLFGNKLQRYDNLTNYNRWRKNWRKIVDKNVKRLGIAKSFDFSEKQKKHLDEVFCESNYLLQKRFDEDIRTYGYYY